ncbi:uncharacterized protein TRAVEDRAFT_45143 [Trametes versicolor FP-101664 SS1]|uniref:uncharacterized protein n=1 Tax=Trametes versicolor (strain FP-101664) TaxID=717944 RepID=UPI0004623A3A|nr:uncharacterized protein TRAVEDRAFT_45143 [Trametes versicolor FP-101664 SS1]EIW62315.1 hypothetical protein TRAVEDRAFT_45143 [Trametes versicolor FP-101664 SS1]
MAPGQLSPFPSCASGLGFMTTPDCLNASSLLTPTASICTISSLTPGGDTEAALSRARAKTMQTKEILKSPQPHRFHLVLSSGRRRTPEIPSLPSRPSAQWRDGLGVPVSPVYSDGGGSTELRRSRPDLFSPAVSPLMPPADIYTEDARFTHSPGTEDYLDDAMPTRSQEERREEACEVEYPASTYSARSASTASASFTLVQDRTSKRLSSASGTVYKDMFTHDYQKTSLLDERLSDTPLCDGNISTCHVDAESAELDTSPPTPMILSEQPLDDIVEIPESETHPSVYSGGDASQANISHTTSGSLYSNSSAYTGYDRDDVSWPGRISVELARSDEALSEAAAPTPAPIPSSPPKPTSARDRRKFALRRQAIYAEYGFQIALPDSGSDSSVKMLANSPQKSRTGRPQMRAASAYMSNSGSARSGLSSSTSSESRRRTAAGADGDEDEMQLFGSANDVDRLGRFSVQEDIMAATRNPLLEDRAELRTSTPQRSAKGGSTGQRTVLGYGSLGPASLSGLGFDSGSPGSYLAAPRDLVWHSGSSTSFGSGDARQDDSDSPWAPLRIRKRMVPAHSELSCISVSASERNARWSAWEFDRGHHPILQDLLDEVDRALEQWTWLAQLRAYRYV